MNNTQVAGAVNRCLGTPQTDERRIAITTLPTTADLTGRIEVDRWVYYCVDDFSVWPGLDGDVIRTMEDALVARADVRIAASGQLQERLEQMPGGVSAALLTHGVELAHWDVCQPDTSVLPQWWSDIERPIYLFWGLVDRRLDIDWCGRLGQAGGTLVLVGPQQDPDARLASMAHVFMAAPVPYEQLPALAAASDVLVMPYGDMPVTRAMQPLKLTEYLATAKPAVVRHLPATAEWADAADVVDDKDRFVQAVQERVRSGLPSSQRHARQRLKEYSWDAKARQFEALILGGQ